MFGLSKLLDYDDIVIQCHNIPDADTIASAFAIYTYFKENGKEPKIIYSGKAEITKTNLLEMVIKLSIPITYVKEMPLVKTLVLVDCQYGERNVEKFEAETVIVIDHHVEVASDYDFGVIRSNLGSCSTLVWDLLSKEQFDFTKHLGVSTALYYGLYTDTGSLEEIVHPLDKDMRDSLKFDTNILKGLKNNNLTLQELDIAGAALTQHKTDHNLGCAMFRSEPCDANILGFISDLALQVHGIDVCVVYNALYDGFKLSIRSCTREVMANEFAQFVTKGVGAGGGHRQKAGGFIDKFAMEKLNVDVDEFIDMRVKEYFKSYEIIDSANHCLDINAMNMYKKKKIPIHCVLSTDIFDRGTPMLIRTLEGDAEAEASDEIYLMIGILGEVYPIKAEKFRNSYTVSDESFEVNFDYFPTAKNRITGDSVDLMKFAKACFASGESRIYAMPLVRNTKVFSLWYEESYMYGKPGDFIAVRADDYNDVYIIMGDIFKKTYEQIYDADMARLSS